VVQVKHASACQRPLAGAFLPGANAVHLTDRTIECGIEGAGHYAATVAVLLNAAP
jgi:hypothetical protein